MLYEPSELRASEKVTANSRGCQDETRGYSTPKEEIELALTNDPRRFSGDKGQEGWIDPKLAAVYVIGNTVNGLCKVGYARDLKKRVLNIAGSCPIPVYLFHFVHVVGHLVAKLVEAEVHECLGEARQHGEWFDVKPEYAAAMIHTVIQERGYVFWDEKGRRELGRKADLLHRKDLARFYRTPRILT